MKKLSFYILLILFFVFYFFYILFNEHGYVQVKDIMAREDNLKSDIMMVKKQNKNMMRKVERLTSDPVYIEYVLRHSQGRVLDDEIVIYVKE